MTKKKIAITGGAGFIGTHLAESYCDENEVVLFDNFRRDSLQHTPKLKDHPNVTVISGDVRDPEAVKKAVDGAEVVLHLAAIAGVSSYYERSYETLSVNVQGTINVLERAGEAKCKHVIHFSTSEVFGPDAMWVTEESGYNIGPVSDRRWVYATSKVVGEQFALRAAEQFGFVGTTVRPFNVYGPRQTGEGAISNFCRAALKGEPLMIYGDGTPIRAWCYIEDFVRGIRAIVDRREAVKGLAFNLGNPLEIATTRQLAECVARNVPGAKLGQKDVVRAEVRSRIPNIDRAKQILDFKPTVTLDEGIRRTYEWFKQVGA